MSTQLDTQHPREETNSYLVVEQHVAASPLAPLPANSESRNAVASLIMSSTERPAFGNESPRVYIASLAASLVPDVGGDSGEASTWRSCVVVGVVVALAVSTVMALQPCGNNAAAARLPMHTRNEAVRMAIGWFKGGYWYSGTNSSRADKLDTESTLSEQETLLVCSVVVEDYVLRIHDVGQLNPCKRRANLTHCSYGQVNNCFPKLVDNHTTWARVRQSHIIDIAIINGRQ